MLFSIVYSDSKNRPVPVREGAVKISFPQTQRNARGCG